MVKKPSPDGCVCDHTHNATRVLRPTRPTQPSQFSALWSPPAPTLPLALTDCVPQARRAASNDVMSRRASAADGPRRVAAFCCRSQASRALSRGRCVALKCSSCFTASCNNARGITQYRGK